MAFWTNYNPKVPRPGTKSTTPNVDGYVIPAGSRMGDFLHSIRQVMVASGNFSYVDHTYTEGNGSSSYYLVMAYASDTTQQYIFLQDEGSIGGYSFDQAIGTAAFKCFGIGGRDTTHTPSPTTFKFLYGTDAVYGFFPNIDDSGSLGIRYWNSSTSTQDVSVYFWSNSNFAVFALYYHDAHEYNSGGSVLFRLDEPADGHYTRAATGATHGHVEVNSYAWNYARLAGIAGGYTSNAILSGTLQDIDSASYIAPPTQGDKLILQRVKIGCSTTIGGFLGTVDGVWIAPWNTNLHYLDTVEIDSKEHICIHRTHMKDDNYYDHYYTVFVQNEA